VDHLVENGTLLYEMACQQGPRRIVAKRMDHPYPTEGKTPLWIKITNPAYSLKDGRGEWLTKRNTALINPTRHRHVAATVKMNTKRGRT